MMLTIIFVLLFSLRVFAQSDSICAFSEDGYSLSWMYDANTDMVVFDLSATPPEGGPDFWTGVGFGQNMADMDFIGVFVRSGQIGIADAYTNDHAQPIPDVIANVNISRLDYSGGKVTASFFRPLNTGDANDKSLADCQIFQFPVSGGLIEGTRLSQHLVTPKNVQVCNIRGCGAGGISDSGNADGGGGGGSLDGALPQDQSGATIMTPIDPFTNSPNVSNPELSLSSGNQTDGGNNSVLPDGSTNTSAPADELEPTSSEGAGTNGGGGSSATAGDGSCSFSSGDYTIGWAFDPATNLINFQLSTLVDNAKFWTGVGIGKDMSNLDVLLAFVDNNIVTEISDFKANKRGAPVRDAQQDVAYANDGQVVDGRVQLSFSRPLATNDDLGDLPIDGDGCNTFQFPVSGGAFGAQNRIRKHVATPVSKEVCAIRTKCVAGQVAPGGGGGVQEPTLSPVASNNETDGINNGTTVSIDQDTTTASFNVSVSAEESTTTTSADFTTTTTADLSSNSSVGDGESTTTSFTVTTPFGESTSTNSADLTTTTTTDLTATLSAGEGQQIANGSSSSTSSGASTTSSPSSVAPLVCSPNQNDLAVCQSYFDNYFARVDKWANTRSFAPESQYPRGCKLIGEVKNVKSLCCNTFVGRCNQYVA